MSKYILGVKLTHDSSVALIKDNQLIFSIENEKLNNGDRYKRAESFDFIEDVLRMYNLSMLNMDVIVIDGWIYDGNIKHLGLKVAEYAAIDSDLTAPRFYDRENFPYEYKSYTHIAGHIIGTYVCSPFAESNQNVIALTFDGGQAPRLDYVSPDQNIPVKYIGNCHVLSGAIYGIMGYYYGPYKDESVISGKNSISLTNKLFHNYSIPGKLMSYIALGKVDETLKFEIFNMYEAIEAYAYSNGLQNMTLNQRGYLEHIFMKEILVLTRQKRLTDADVLLTIHTFLEELLVKRITSMTMKGLPLIYSGGCALNIKWNTALIESWHFSDIWIPPFANDTGSALGMAACEMALEDGIWELDWSVYSGPAFEENNPSDNWYHIDLPPRELGWFFDQNPEECVVCLIGNAEIGPRALGHRSLLMSPKLKSNKEKLNTIKKREDFRPVAPIVLDEDSNKLFKMVKHDPFMLYDHELIDENKDKIPAIMHLDNTARVQVVKKEHCNVIHEILTGYKEKSGFGILCNTSANESGKGFFPDLYSATEWAEKNGVEYVWTNNKMYVYCE